MSLARSVCSRITHALRFLRSTTRHPAARATDIEQLEQVVSGTCVR